jgi:hypothetical protein
MNNGAATRAYLASCTGLTAGIGVNASTKRYAMSGLDRPFVIFAIALIAQWLAVYAGRLLGARCRPLSEVERNDFDIVRAATLTLLGLIIGFSFSMAVSRYDQRKNYEEAEANAIGTEYVRADLLLADAAAPVRELLRKYLDRRIAFYLVRDSASVSQIDDDTTKLEGELWSAILRSAKAKPDPIVALVVAGMNDVLNSQGYTQAAWWNRIPIAAWAMLGLIAIASNTMVGYGAHRRAAVMFVLPIVVSSAFLLIADIDSPRGGIIRVLPQNLMSLSQSIKAQ